MMKALKSLSLFGGLAVVLTLFLFFGCSNKNPVQPTDPTALELGKLPGPQTSNPGGEEYDEGWIEYTVGGAIDIERGDYAHLFEIDPYALAQDTLITIRSDNEQVLGKQMIVFEFGPEGLEFGTSSRLIFEVAELGIVGTTAKMYYYNPDTGLWVYQGSSSIRNGLACFYIDHFSKYAISD